MCVSSLFKIIKNKNKIQINELNVAWKGKKKVVYERGIDVKILKVKKPE